MSATKPAFLIVLALVSACQSWQQIPRPAADVGLEGSPQVVRVTRTMGCGPTPSSACMARRGTITVYNPRVQGDSLIGYYDSDNRERVAIAVGDITAVESKKVGKLRTAGAIAGGALTVYAVLSALLVIALLAALD